MLMVIFLPRGVPGERTRRWTKLCRDPQQGLARLDGPQLLRQWVRAEQQQRRGEKSFKLVMSGSQKPGRPPVIIHTLAATRLYYRTDTGHNTSHQSVEVMFILSNAMMTTVSSDGQINGHGLE